MQFSFQDAEPANADLIGNFKDGHARKLEVGRLIVAVGLPLTFNAVVHPQNRDNLPAIIELAVALGAGRLEVATYSITAGRWSTVPR